MRKPPARRRAEPKRPIEPQPERTLDELKPDDLARVAGGYQDDPHGYFD